MAYVPNRRNRAPIGRASFRTARSHSVSAARRFGPVPGTDEILFLPLGGCSRIGMNMALYGHAGKWLIVDAGVAFVGDEAPGIEAVMVDPGFIEDRIDDVVGLVVTHAHEDHIGAIHHLWPRLRMTSLSCDNGSSVSSFMYKRWTSRVPDRCSPRM